MISTDAAQDLEVNMPGQYCGSLSGRNLDKASDFLLQLDRHADIAFRVRYEHFLNECGNLHKGSPCNQQVTCVLVGRICMSILSFGNERYTLSSASIARISARNQSLSVLPTSSVIEHASTASRRLAASTCLNHDVIPSHQNSPKVCKGASSLVSINAEQKILCQRPADRAPAG